LAGFTNSMEVALLEHAFKISPMSVPGNITVALYTTTPDPETGVGGVEVSGGSYARQTVNAWTRSGTAPTQVANTNLVTFPTPSADWGLVTTFGILFDGVLVGVKALQYAKTINIDDAVTFPAGYLVVNLD